jgi:hypothetical protein
LTALSLLRKGIDKPPKPYRRRSEAPDNDGHDGVAGPATALLIIATDMSTMVTTIMVTMVMIGADELPRGGDDRSGQLHDRHRRHQQQHQRVR